MLAQRVIPLFLLLSLGACERLSNALDLPDPQKTAALAEAEGKAIGGACRHAGRSLEDCYALNAKAQKAAIFAGWREMNDYMMQNNLPNVPSQVAHPQAPVAAAAHPAAGSPPAAADAGTVAEDRAVKRPRAAQ
ncbi:hypothetical protein LLG90_16915 [Aromatoleum toluclasticum]|uniref:hypothetical protein n=1 Tax=Aromatoleum toluclasticum TaxID=92003 RepID=UPI000375DC30|nr:hypothetical protein [Aromatoleum toluclasticum]MCC4117036.1 hypothetical protein [Aromatoleum toluclasticum]